MRRTETIGLLVALLSCVACEDGSVPRQATPHTEAGTAGQHSEPAAGAGTGGAADGEGAYGAAGASESGGSGGLSVGAELKLDVAADEPTFVRLDSARAVTGAPGEKWDLRLQGWDIFTNGGASGGGKGAAFGPLPFTYFLEGRDPTEIPFLIEDKAAGAFRDWYAYDGQWHTLYSRFHVYGVRTGDRLFKVQVLGYYGDVQGAPIGALYRLRYAEVTPQSTGRVVEVKQLDATAGGLGGDEGAPSAALSLLSGEQAPLTPSQAAAATSWDLLFRRDSISVNGGLGGPGDVTAVDLDAASQGEALEQLAQLSAENQAARFESVDHAALTSPELRYRGDRVVSAFTDAWVDTSQKPPGLAPDNTWLVVDADGESRFLVSIMKLERSTQGAAGTVTLRILGVR
jgi:hypothetical protein